MDQEKILRILKNMPNFNEDLKDKYVQLISVAINIITAKLKSNAKKNNDELLLVLCAYLVNLWVTLETCSNSSIGTFAGNGYKIKKDSKKQCLLAKKLFEHWRAMAAGLLVDEGFCFYAVKGLS